MKTRPSGVLFNAHTPAEDFRAFATLFFDALTAAGLPAVKRWQTGDDPADRDPRELPAAIEALPKAAGRAQRRQSGLYFELVDSTRGNVRFSAERGVAFCGSHLHRPVRNEDTLDTLLTFQRCCVLVSQHLLRQVGLHSVDLGAEGGGVRCIPEVPLVEDASHIVATDRAEAMELYDDPDAFWNAGWTVVEEHNGRFLLARDMDVVCGADYLARIIEHQWSMARAAKPKETRFVRPAVLPEEEPIFKSGAPRLQGVGYSAEEKLVEYACAIGEGEHIRGWEIYALLNIIEQRRLSDGSPVETVRVVFLDAWAAMQEKRPLLDIGCRVYHYDSNGELVELTE